jgi:hypothetical protein
MLKGIASVFLGTRAGTGLYAIDKLIDLIRQANKPVEDELQSAKVILGTLSCQHNYLTFLTPLTML